MPFKYLTKGSSDVVVEHLGLDIQDLTKCSVSCQDVFIPSLTEKSVLLLGRGCGWALDLMAVRLDDW